MEPFTITLKRKIAAAFSSKMSDEAWLSRANPWSECTRLICFLFLEWAIWSWVVLGWRLPLPILCAVILMFLSHHVFPKPRSTNNWISKGVLGERVWSNRDQVPLSQHHRRVPNLLSVIEHVGVILLGVGFGSSNAWVVVFGCTLAILSRLWCLDRMVL
jgi:hypothetical protein